MSHRTEVAIQADAPGSLLAAIVQMASNPAVDVTKLDAILKMQERMEARQGEIEFGRALSRLSAKMPHVKKNGKIPLPMKDGSIRDVPFAKWEDMDRAIRPLMFEEGFILSFDSQARVGEGGGLVVTGTLSHRDGFSRSASMPLALDTGPGRNNLQAMGSTLSYGKRYCAEMLLNIVRAGDDDDGMAGGAEPITDEECAELSRELTATGSNLDAFLKYMGVEAIPDIKKRDLTRARNAIASKKKKAGA